MADGNLYFHSPCFDGIVSAVLAWDFLEARSGWREPALHPVNYDLRSHWLERPLSRPSALVDFLYHPDANLWADHHVSAFLNASARAAFLSRTAVALTIYDSSADSCAGLLWERFYKSFDHRTARHEDVVAWAEKIDSARYESVAETIHPTVPALRLNLSLAVGGSGSYSSSLVRALREMPIDEVANMPDARSRYEQAEALFDAGLARFERAAHIEEDGIVIFNVDTKDVLISRYAPYYFFPGARYSIGLLQWGSGARITAMRNPWSDFPSVPLGKIAETLGGGGHQRIGSIALQGERLHLASSLLKTFTERIRRADRRKTK